MAEWPNVLPGDSVELGGGQGRPLLTRERSRSMDSTSSAASDDDRGLDVGRPTPRRRRHTVPRVRVAVALGVTLGLQALSWIAYTTTDAGVENKALTDTAVIAVTAVAQILQVVLVLLFAFLVVNSLWVVPLDLGSAWSLYTVTFLTFAGVYLLLYITVDDAFAHTPLIESYVGGSPSTAVPAGGIVIVMLYNAVAVQTLVGFGDVYPVHGLARAVVAVHLAIAIPFSFVLLSQALPVFSRHRRPHGRHDGGAAPYWKRCTRVPFVRSMRRGLREYIGVVCVLYNAAVFAVLDYVSPSLHPEGSTPAAAIVFGFIAEALFAALLASVTRKYVVKPHNMSLRFLVQFFAALVIVFGMLYLLAVVSLAGAGFYFGVAGSPSLFRKLMATLQFSLVTMSSAGFGATFPTHNTTRLVCAVQMVVSEFCFMAILSYGIQTIKHRRRRNAQLSRVSVALAARIAALPSYGALE